jgi:hypothetical protein
MPHQSELDPDFETRWAAWLARGATHERAVRHRLVIIMPAVLVVAVVVYAWLTR